MQANCLHPTKKRIRRRRRNTRRQSLKKEWEKKGEWEGRHLPTRNIQSPNSKAFYKGSYIPIYNSSATVFFLVHFAYIEAILYPLK